MKIVIFVCFISSCVLSSNATICKDRTTKSDCQTLSDFDTLTNPQLGVRPCMWYEDEDICMNALHSVHLIETVSFSYPGRLPRTNSDIRSYVSQDVIEWYTVFDSDDNAFNLTQLAAKRKRLPYIKCANDFFELLDYDIYLSYGLFSKGAIDSSVKIDAFIGSDSQMYVTEGSATRKYEVCQKKKPVQLSIDYGTEYSADKMLSQECIFSNNDKELVYTTGPTRYAVWKKDNKLVYQTTPYGDVFTLFGEAEFVRTIGCLQKNSHLTVKFTGSEILVLVPSFDKFEPLPGVSIHPASIPHAKLECTCISDSPRSCFAYITFPFTDPSDPLIVKGTRQVVIQDMNSPLDNVVPVNTPIDVEEKTLNVLSLNWLGMPAPEIYWPGLYDPFYGYSTLIPYGNHESNGKARVDDCYLNGLSGICLDECFETAAADICLPFPTNLQFQLTPDVNSVKQFLREANGGVILLTYFPVRTDGFPGLSSTSYKSSSKSSTKKSTMKSRSTWAIIGAVGGVSVVLFAIVYLVMA